ncbi:MAG TPA: class I SAM-dependent methyltransferase [Streptosporangiaceae bacterium]|nr:class I SAM-dependent methyltransferase [Streptosporangiaceae bacterium]
MPAADLAEVQRRARELGPWVNAFEYQGNLFPKDEGLDGETPLQPRRGRAQAFFEAFPDARRILELGSLEGADTVRLARHPGTDVVAVEGRAEHVARARFVAGLHDLANARFVHADVETFDLTSLGCFDAVLCAGLLYHLQEPWSLLTTLAAMTEHLFLSTHYWGGDGTVQDRGFAIKMVTESHPEPRTRALAQTVRWFDRDSLFRAIREAGFNRIDVLDERRTDTVCDLVAACYRPPATQPGSVGRR